MARDVCCRGACVSGGMHGRGACMAEGGCMAVYARICMTGGSVHGPGGTRVVGEHVWQERRPLQCVVRILLGCIHVLSVDNSLTTMKQIHVHYN